MSAKYGQTQESTIGVHPDSDLGRALGGIGESPTSTSGSKQRRRSKRVTTITVLPFWNCEALASSCRWFKTLTNTVPNVEIHHVRDARTQHTRGARDCLGTDQITAALFDSCWCSSRVQLALSRDFHQSKNAKQLAIFVEQSRLKNIILTVQ